MKDGFEYKSHELEYTVHSFSHTKINYCFFRSLYGTRRNQENLSYFFLLSLAKASIKGEEVAILSVLADGVDWDGASSNESKTNAFSSLQKYCELQRRKAV